MQHCLIFKPLDIWFLSPTNEYFKRKINIGFCPICGAPVAEYWQFEKGGNAYCQRFTGVEANNICEKLKSQIEFKGNSVRLAKMRERAYGWVYGVNKLTPDGNEVMQFAKDFYGNEELVKKIDT